MSDNKRGLYIKFKNIERTDGRSSEGEKHHECDYFILDLTHDIHAIKAVDAYADSCDRHYPKLAADLRDKALEMRGSHINLPETGGHGSTF